MLKNIFYILFCYIIIPATANCKTENKWYFVNSVGISYQKLQNFNMSPLIYKGGTIFINNQFERRNEKNYINFNFNLWFGYVTPKSEDTNFTTNNMVTKIMAEYQYLKILKKKILTCDFYYGFTITPLFNLRYNKKYSNNALDSDFSFSLNPAFSIQKSFFLKQHLSIIKYTPAISVIAYNIVPSFASYKPEIFITKSDLKIIDYFKAGKIVTLNKFQYIKSELAFEYFLKNGNAIGLRYIWDLSNTITSNKIVMSSHTFIFTTYFNLK
jgi:hypothetical protein